MDYSPPGSSVLSGILQARILEWVAIPFSRGSSWNPGLLLHCRQIPYQLSHQGNPGAYLWARPPSVVSWDPPSSPGVRVVVSSVQVTNVRLREVREPA